MKTTVSVASAACLAASLLSCPCAHAKPVQSHRQQGPMHFAAPTQTIIRSRQQPVRVVRPSRVVRMRFSPIGQYPTMGTDFRRGPQSNGVTVRNVYLWRQPAKIEPHIQQVDQGRPVQVVGQQQGFYAVVLHNGRQGWLPMDAVRHR